MKKNILFISAFLILGFMAFGWVNLGDSENSIIDNFNYEIGSRDGTTITKEDLHGATSVLDIVPEVATDWWTVDFQKVTVAVLEDGVEIKETGVEKALSNAQIKLLQSTDYSSSFYIKARSKNKHPETGEIEDYKYRLTVVPEKEAEYAEGGMDGLIAHLKEGSKRAIAIAKEAHLERGQIVFTISRNGTPTDIKLLATSGYSSIDKVMIELMANTRAWIPAKNLNGENVDQEFVFSFGRGGC